MDNFHPTAYPDLNNVLKELISSLELDLVENFLGAYLQGSFAIGDYDIHSDLDFIVVTENELTARQIQSLQVLHSRIFDLDSAWAQHLEGSYFPKKVLRHPPQPGALLWYLDNGSNTLIESDHCNSLVVRWVVREHGVILAGPSPETLFDPVTIEMLREEIMEVIRKWGAEILISPANFNNRFYQSFIVLSFCRMLHDFKVGSIGSKLTGAEWAKIHLDPTWRDLIDSTWDARPHPELTVRQPANKEDFEKTLEFVRYAIDFITNELSI